LGRKRIGAGVKGSERKGGKCKAAWTGWERQFSPAKVNRTLEGAERGEISGNWIREKKKKKNQHGLWGRKNSP